MKKISTFILGVVFSLVINLNSYSVTWNVNVLDFAFNPANLPSVHVGDTIRWQWIGPTVHTTTSLTVPTGAATWDVTLFSSNTTFRYVLTTPGNYTYNCTPHPQMTGSITANIIGITPIQGEVPQSFKLNQNYPNPFNPVTDIKFDIPASTFVKLTVYNVLGGEVEVLVNQQLNAGSYKVDWNAADYPSGVYIYKMVSGDYTETKKMILIK